MSDGSLRRKTGPVERRRDRHNVLSGTILQTDAVGIKEETKQMGLDFNCSENKFGTLTIIKYTGAGGDVSIPAQIDGKQVTVIGASAFQGCAKLTGVTIPDGITDIEDYAFRDCTSLTGITIPNGVFNIGTGAFYGCSCLTGITIPNSVANIWESTFFECASLASITIPKNVTNIGTDAFTDCTGLIGVTFQGTLDPNCFDAFAFPGDLRAIYLAGGAGRYTRQNGYSLWWAKG